jgi:hypothetical protein
MGTVPIRVDCGVSDGADLGGHYTEAVDKDDRPLLLFFCQLEGLDPNDHVLLHFNALVRELADECTCDLMGAVAELTEDETVAVLLFSPSVGLL